VESVGGSVHLTFQSHYSYAFKKGLCSPTKLGVTVWMNFLPPRKNVVCTSAHEEFLRLGFMGMGKNLRIWCFRPGLLLGNVGREYATSMGVETAFMWMWLMTDFLYENSKEGHPCDMAERQQAAHFVLFVCHRWSDSSPA